MDNNERFIIYISSIVAATLVSMVGGCTYNQQRESQAIERLIKNGTEPIAARCAIGGIGEGRGLLCSLTIKK